MKFKLIGILAIMILLVIILGIMFIPTAKTSDGFQDIQNWEIYDYSKQSLGNYLEGYTGTIVEKKFVYFVSHDSSLGKHGEVLRYDTSQEFDSVEAWSTFDASKNGVGNNANGFADGIFDGQFVYFVPLFNNENFHGEVLRYDTSQEFDSVEAWSTFDAGNFGIGFHPDGYSGIVSDGQFLYFAPYHNGANFHGEVLRYDTHQEFDSVEAWSTFDASKNGVGYDATGYWGGTFDGQFVYFSPDWNSDGPIIAEPHGEVLRYDTHQEFDSVEAWSTFDASKNGVGSDATGYWGAVYGGGAIYFAPSFYNGVPHGTVLKYNIGE